MQVSGQRQNNRDYVGYGRETPQFRWPADTGVAVNIVINYEEGSEVDMARDGRNESGLGEVPSPMPANVRDFALESVYEYGSRAGIWRLARLLDERRIPVTVFGCADALALNPQFCEWIRQRQHDVCCHGLRWEEAWRLSRSQEQANMLAAIDSIDKHVGARPLGWYCRYGPSSHTRELLIEEGGFTYDSDAYNDDLPYFVDAGNARHLVLPYSHTYNDSRFVRAQGYSSPTDFVDHLKRALDWYRLEGATHPKMMSVGLHARLAGQAARASAVAEFIDYARCFDDVWFARRIDIARHWLRVFG